MIAVNGNTIDDKKFSFVIQRIPVIGLPQNILFQKNGSKKHE
jgi:hypothetical protein